MFDQHARFLHVSDGNGFKTSTMRLGADVIVFSRSRGKDGKRLSICSYTNVGKFMYTLIISIMSLSYVKPSSTM